MKDILKVIGRYLLGIIICRCWGLLIKFLTLNMDGEGLLVAVIIYVIYVFVFYRRVFWDSDVDAPVIRKILYWYLYIVTPILCLIGNFISVCL